MTIDRTTIISGPALVQYDSQTFYSKGDITLKTIVNRTQINTSAFGIIDERATDKRIEVVFEPAGQFTDALAAVLWPYASTMPGTSVFGSTDKALVIWGRDGQKHTVKNARVTTMPNIQFGTTKTTIGSITFTGLVANSADPSLLASYYTVAAATYPGDTTFDPGEIWTLGPIVMVGIESDLLTEDGVDVSFSVAMREEMVDGIGTVDMKIGNVEATATMTLVSTYGLNELDGGIGDASNTLAFAVSTGVLGAPEILFGNSFITESELGWGDRKRNGQISVKAQRLFTLGVAQPLYTIQASGA